MAPPDVGPDRRVARAVEVLRRGGLVAFPTETVYGLGADATNQAAVDRVFEAKGRPSAHPLIVHLDSAQRLDAVVAAVPDAAARLAERFWPGPLTVVLARGPAVLDAVTGGLDTVAVRVPAHPLALELLRRFGRPVVAPSANRFGRVSPTTAADVEADLGRRIDLVLDGGPCRVGVESTIVDLSGPRPTLLRPGGLPREAIEEVLGGPLSLVVPPGVRAPGRMPSHYAPRAVVELVEAATTAGRATHHLAAGARLGVVCSAAPPGLPAGAEVLAPTEPGSTAFARALYGLLREADRRGCDVVLAVVPEETGIGAAVADRLRRAAGPREG